MMGAPRYRLAFLGERRIAWEALRMLATAPWRGAFDVRVLVSSAEMVAQFSAISPSGDRRFIGNDARRSLELHQAIEAEGVNLLVSVQHNWILPPEVLDAVGREAFNLHNARLPDYRGYNSIAHAILNGDRSYLSTVHWIADAVDQGDAAFQEATDILPQDTARSLYLRTVEASKRALVRLFQALAGGEPIPRTPTGGDAGAFYPRNSLEALADVTDLDDAERTERIVRALYFPPYNSAWIRVDGTRRRLLPKGESERGFDAQLPANAPIYGEIMSGASR